MFCCKTYILRVNNPSTQVRVDDLHNVIPFYHSLDTEEISLPFVCVFKVHIRQGCSNSNPKEGINPAVVNLLVLCVFGHEFEFEQDKGTT